MRLGSLSHLASDLLEQKLQVQLAELVNFDILLLHFLEQKLKGPVEVVTGLDGIQLIFCPGPQAEAIVKEVFKRILVVAFQLGD